jgi:ABC-2 type transport system ATP-binding protein
MTPNAMNKEPSVIEVNGLTKKYGDVVAVDDITFSVKPGVVTGFLGPNGAGKSTTMRMILGLDRATSGSSAINGKPYGASAHPMLEVGALIDAKANDKARTARNHLRCLAATLGISNARVDEVLNMVGLEAVADRTAGGFSLGMGQRLGIATALLADPAVIMLDEPVNGLDPDGIMWVRTLLNEMAAEGRTVFLSSHLMSEMELTADHLIIIGQGRILADRSMAAFIADASRLAATVGTADVGRLAPALVSQGATVSLLSDTRMHVEGLAASAIGEVALQEQCPLLELTPEQPSLEDAFMTLTRDAVEYQGHGVHA